MRDGVSGPRLRTAVLASGHSWEVVPEVSPPQQGPAGTGTRSARNHLAEVGPDARDATPAGLRATMPGMDIGQVAYEGYRVSCDGKSIRGEDLPPWDGQAPAIREHWRAAADAVKMWLDMHAASPEGK